jgi:hypothetical protein
MPRLSYPKRHAIKQALQMQDSFAHCVKVLEADFLASTERDERARLATAMGNLGRNWTALQDTIRVLKGVPLPGSLTHEKVQTRRAPRALSPLSALASRADAMQGDAQSS